MSVTSGSLTIIPAAPRVTSTGAPICDRSAGMAVRSRSISMISSGRGLACPTASNWLALMATLRKSRIWARLSAQKRTFGCRVALSASADRTAAVTTPQSASVT